VLGPQLLASYANSQLNRDFTRLDKNHGNSGARGRKAVGRLTVWRRRDLARAIWDDTLRNRRPLRALTGAARLAATRALVWRLRCNGRYYFVRDTFKPTATFRHIFFFKHSKTNANNFKVIVLKDGVRDVKK